MAEQPEPLGAVEALTRLGGVATSSELTALSSRRRVRSALRRGEVVRLGFNLLALPVSDQGLLAARAVGGVASHLTAALHHGWKVKFPPDVAQVTVPPGHEIPDDPGVVVEVVVRRIPAADRDGWATTKLRTVLDCARDLAFDVALCVADSALRAGDVTKEDLVSTAGRLTGPGADRVRLVAAYADGRASNPFESVLRALAMLAGLAVIPQYEITCGGLVLHPDLANPLLGIVLEADSYEFHGMQPWDHAEDCQRYNAMTCAGWAVLRFTWTQVMHSPDQTLLTIRTWLAQSSAA